MLDRTTALLVHVPAGELNDALKRTRIAISSDETRYYLGGVLLQLDKRANRLVFTATDGHRLAKVTTPAPTDCPDFAQVILPRYFVAEAIKATNKRRHSHRDVTLSVSSDKIILAMPGLDANLECAPIDGTFPDCNRVIPVGTPEIGTATMNREAFANAVGAVHAFRSFEGKQSSVKFSFGVDAVTISAETEGGSASVTVKIDDTTMTETRDVGFNGRYISEMLATMDDHGSPVVFRFYDPTGPNVFCQSANEHAPLYVIMPMRI